MKRIIEYQAHIVQGLTIEVDEGTTQTEAFNQAFDTVVADLHGTYSVTKALKVERLSAWPFTTFGLADRQVPTDKTRQELNHILSKN